MSRMMSRNRVPPMRNLEAGILFKWINLILGLEVRGQPSPQLYSDEGLQSNWFKNKLVWLKYINCDSFKLFGLVWLNRFSVLALRNSPELRNRKRNCLTQFSLKETPSSWLFLAAAIFVSRYGFRTVFCTCTWFWFSMQLLYLSLDTGWESISCSRRFQSFMSETL